MQGTERYKMLEESFAIIKEYDAIKLSLRIKHMIAKVNTSIQ